MADLITDLTDDSIRTVWPQTPQMAGGDDDTTDEGSPGDDTADDSTDDTADDSTDDDTSDADQDGTDA